MKHVSLLASLLVFVCVALGVPDEASLRKVVTERGADFAYRFSSWSSANRADSFSITFVFFFAKNGGSYSAHQSGMPIPKNAEVDVVVTRKGKLSTIKRFLNQKEADMMLCRFGYSGFFAHDSDDATREVLDGHGLDGERLFKGSYSARSRKCEESLSCEWLYSYLEDYGKKG